MVRTKFAGAAVSLAVGLLAGHFDHFKRSQKSTDLRRALGIVHAPGHLCRVRARRFHVPIEQHHESAPSSEADRILRAGLPPAACHYFLCISRLKSFLYAQLGSQNPPSGRESFVRRKPPEEDRATTSSKGKGMVFESRRDSTWYRIVNMRKRERVRSMYALGRKSEDRWGWWLRRSPGLQALRGLTRSVRLKTRGTEKTCTWKECRRSETSPRTVTSRPHRLGQEGDRAAQFSCRACTSCADSPRRCRRALSEQGRCEFLCVRAGVSCISDPYFRSRYLREKERKRRKTERLLCFRNAPTVVIFG